ncbi:MAG TPA: dTDP-4-dehydrorhamnose reductase [Spirochaetota bacterium]|nr:dTDP-4-dehydrorhamnose reductase [Spirochaetota bacterium]
MIWIIGNNGMLGKELSALCDSAGIPYVGSDRECDITDVEALRSFAAGKDVKWIVNCSAYTAVDKAEDEETLAYAINAAGAVNIAIVASETGAKMIHISTDYVFGGDGSRPYKEDDPVNPTGAYGRTKYAGEEFVRKHCSSHIIIRTAWLYGRHGKNFVETMLRLFREKGFAGVVCDQRGTPTWAYDLASAIVFFIRHDFSGYGTYHFTDDGETNWYEFACEIRRIAVEKGIIKDDVRVNSLTTEQFPTRAVRPKYSVLDKTKIKSAGVEVPEWKKSLTRYMENS